MKTLEIMETARELLDGAIYDAEQITASDALYLSDLLETQGYALRINDELSLVYAVSDSIH
jgi:hypothetical protein